MVRRTAIRIPRMPGTPEVPALIHKTHALTWVPMSLVNRPTSSAKLCCPESRLYSNPFTAASHTTSSLLHEFDSTCSQMSLSSSRDLTQCCGSGANSACTEHPASHGIPLLQLPQHDPPSPPHAFSRVNVSSSMKPNPSTGARLIECDDDSTGDSEDSTIQGSATRPSAVSGMFGLRW